MEKYITQKAQKIVSALYLTTDFIKDSDAIKWEIREEGISLVSHSMMLNGGSVIDKEHATHLLVSSLEKILTLLNVASIASLISKMNSNILIHEVKSLSEFLLRESKENHLPGYILSDAFFATDKVEDKSEIDHKGQLDSSKTLMGQAGSDTRKEDKKVDKQSNRKESIISLLKKDSNLRIKDFARVIKDCSEKTIQRELISLVKQGVVKREGERRWCTYSLKNQ